VTQRAILAQFDTQAFSGHFLRGRRAVKRRLTLCLLLLAWGCDDAPAEADAGMGGSGGMPTGGVMPMGGMPTGGATVPPGEATACVVYERIITDTCAQCHSGLGSQRPDLSTLAAFMATVGAPSGYPDQTLVVANDPDASLLYQKMLPGAPGGVMPRAPFEPYGEPITNIMRDWIASGATPDCDAGPEVALLGPEAQLIRAAMALKGTRPTVAEMDRVANDPAALAAVVDGYLDTAEFGETVRDMHNATLQMRRLLGMFFPLRNELANIQPNANDLRSALTEEPLRLAEYIIREGRDYREIVTADYTLANDLTKHVWGEDVREIGGQMVPAVVGAVGLQCGDAMAKYDGWRQCRYLENGRTGGGVLNTNAFFLRHTSNGGNYNRGRANKLTSAFVCFDFLDKPIDFTVSTDADLADPDAVLTAVKNAPCNGCHDDLDPLARFLFQYRDMYTQVRLSAEGVPFWMYNPSPGHLRRAQGVPDAAYFGAPFDADREATPNDLGTFLANDPRFVSCTIKNFYGFLSQSDARTVETLPEYSAWQAAFVDGGYDARALIKAIVLSDTFNASHATGEEGADDVVGMKMVRPRQAERLFEDLTGFVWRYDPNVALQSAEGDLGSYRDVALLRDSVIGFEVLAGGIDSNKVPRPSFSPNAVTSSVWWNLASEAASFTVQQDLGGDAPRLLTLVEANTNDEPTIRTQLVALHLRLYGERVAPDSEEVDATYQLFRSAADRADVLNAWRITLTAMLQDARVLFF
jgi:hypothetical protein